MKGKSALRIISNVLEARKAILNEFVPDEAQQHFHSSRREFLRGILEVLGHSCSESDIPVDGGVRQPNQERRSIDIQG